MKRCIVSTSCSYPEGECAGLCLHRLIRPVEQRMSVEYAEGHENAKRRPVGPLRYAINTYRLYRRWGISRKASLRHALRAWKQH